ncbi:hypothetical protein F4861DRAFT_540146 [Xylaria intraflava]|nr:hypothetical protein F4861DRAFT_540146 [Xylaria intraflava]
MPSGEAPIRIVLQTKTHHVPGGDYQERCRNMKNLLSQHLWNQDFDHRHDRWQVYRAMFGYPGRTCYFLLDHGCDSATSNDVPVLWYKWTGKSFKLIESPLPHAMRAKLKEYPFIPSPCQLPLYRGPVDAAMRRQMIRTRLLCDMKLSRPERELLEDPEQVAALKSDIDPRFWPKIDALAGDNGDASAAVPVKD